jgi:hypothetical protein
MVIYYLDNDKRWTKIRDGEAVVHVKKQKIFTSWRGVIT